MRHPVALLCSLSLLAAVGCAAPDHALFNGHDLAGWELVAGSAMDIRTVCQVRPDGVVTVTGKPSGYFATIGSHRDFQLHAEWRWPGKPGNSGVLLHISSGPKDRSWPLSLQVQLKNGNAGDILPMAGATYAEPLANVPASTPTVKARTAPESEKPAGEWNTCDITCRNGTINVVINDVRQNYVMGANPAAGRVGFQLEGVPYELRNVWLKPLD